MKRLIAFLLAMTMLLSLCACGNNKKDDSADKGGDTTTTTAEGDTTTVGDGTTTTVEDTTTTTVGEGTTTTAAPTQTEDTKAPTKAPVTTTTTAAPEVPEEPELPEEPDNRPQLKVLSIGHSFSVDAMETYMWDLFEAAGYNVTIGYLYFPGCSLERQYHYILENKANYHRYAKNSDGHWEKESAVQVDPNTNEVIKGGVRALTALWDEDWDIVTFQPSPDYGAGTMKYPCKWGCNKQVNDYDHFNALVDYVLDTLADPYNPNGPNTDVKIYYHLTWAFAQDCKLWSFMYSNFNQMQMYQDFIDATQTYVVPNEHVEGVIPCITAIQNARTSWIGDNFNLPGGEGQDGYHLNDKGDLVAAMTWVAYFTGKKAMDFKIGCRYSDAEYAVFAEAVDNAINNPWSVTESVYKTAP